MMRCLVSIMRLCVLKATQAYCYEEVRNYEKFYSSKALLKIAGGGGCILHTAPGSVAKYLKSS